MRLKLIAAVIVLGCGPVQAQEIYKHVLSDGSVVYTDQKPRADSVPMELPEVTVVQASRPAARQGDAEELEPNYRELYKDFALVEPAPEQTYWNSSFTITARAASSQPLPDGFAVKFLLDGLPRGSSASYSMLLDEVYRGEHQLEAQLVGPRGAVVASDTVTFHMKQTSIRR